MEVSAVIRLRPTRVALLVDAKDMSSIKRFLQLSVTMWGGVFHPIIPIFRGRVPPAWGRQPPWMPKLNARDIARGFVEFFEPDIFVEAEQGLAESIGIVGEDKLMFAQWTVVPLDKLLLPQDHRSYADLRVGLNIVEILESIYERERRFQLRDPGEAFLVDSHPNSAVSEAIFGVYPADESASYIRRAFADVYRPKTLPPTAETWRAVMKGGATPLRLTRHETEMRTGSAWDEPAVFLFDPRKPLDVVEFWNSRLEHEIVLPVPIQWAKDLAPDVARFIRDNFRPVEGNPNGVMHSTAMLYARSLSAAAINKAVAAIRLHLGEQQRKPGSLGPLSFPLISHEIWQRPPNDQTPARARRRIEATEVRVTLDVKDGHDASATFDVLTPPFARRYGGESFRWVNTVSLSPFGPSTVATVYPYNTFDRSWPRLRLADAIVIGSEGWVCGERYGRGTEYLRLESAEDAVIDSFKNVGIEVKLSEPGQIAKQVVNSLQGLRGAHLLADEQTLRTLNRMAGGTRRQRLAGSPEEDEDHFERRSSPIHEWEALVARRQREQKGWGEVSLSGFTDRNIIRLGTHSKCPHCAAKNWHSLSIVDYSLTCERCLKNYPFPQASPSKENWAYRVVGPFAVPDYARGSYCAVLALRAISSLVGFHSQMTFSTALGCKVDDRECEIDFATWHQPESFDTSPKPTLLIGEAKSLGKNDVLSRDDIDRLRLMGGRVPGSALVVAILRDTFTETERAMLRDLVAWGRRSDTHGWATNPVLLLTQTELFGHGSIEHLWKKKGGEHAKFIQHFQTSTLRQIADSTTAIHLGIPTLGEERAEAWQKGQLRTRSKAAAIG